MAPLGDAATDEITASPSEASTSGEEVAIFIHRLEP